MRLRIEGFAHGHIAFHESDQSGIVQPPQAGTFPASVGAQAAGDLLRSAVQEDGMPHAVHALHVVAPGGEPPARRDHRFAACGDRPFERFALRFAEPCLAFITEDIGHGGSRLLLDQRDVREAPLAQRRRHEPHAGAVQRRIGDLHVVELADAFGRERQRMHLI